MEKLHWNCLHRSDVVFLLSYWKLPGSGMHLAFEKVGRLGCSLRAVFQCVTLEPLYPYI